MLADSKLDEPRLGRVVMFVVARLTPNVNSSSNGVCVCVWKSINFHSHELLPRLYSACTEIDRE